MSDPKTVLGMGLVGRPPSRIQVHLDCGRRHQGGYPEDGTVDSGVPRSRAGSLSLRKGVVEERASFRAGVQEEEIDAQEGAPGRAASAGESGSAHVQEARLWAREDPRFV